MELNTEIFFGLLKLVLSKFGCSMRIIMYDKVMLDYYHAYSHDTSAKKKKDGNITRFYQKVKN